MRWRDTARFWNDFGQRNPFGIILTGANHEPREWDTDAFFATGADEVTRLMTELGALAPRLPRRAALDFGCGVGRISRALAAHFERVVGLDVAPSMIAAARRLNQASPRCRFSVNRSARLGGIASDTFDFVYSRLVLQHIPPRSVRRYIAELVRVLAPGGILMFQVPEPLGDEPDVQIRAEEAAFLGGPIADTRLKRRTPRWVIRAYRRVRFRRLMWRRRQTFRMYMFGIARTEVLRVVATTGASVVRIDADRSHGDQGAGYAYWITKPTRV